jgi:pyruvate ferredoxin oxidoreductase alpha subunit
MTMGSMVGTARYVIDKLREEGKPIGLVKLKTFRPFPTEEVRKIGSRVKVIGFVDRAISQASAGGGPASVETCSALYSLDERPLFLSFYAGLVGREVDIGDIEKIAHTILKTLENKRVDKEVNWPQLYGGAD